MAAADFMAKALIAKLDKDAHGIPTQAALDELISSIDTAVKGEEWDAKKRWNLMDRIRRSAKKNADEIFNSRKK